MHDKGECSECSETPGWLASLLVKATASEATTLQLCTKLQGPHRNTAENALDDRGHAACSVHRAVWTISLSANTEPTICLARHSRKFGSYFGHRLTRPGSHAGSWTQQAGTQ